MTWYIFQLKCFVNNCKVKFKMHVNATYQRFWKYVSGTHLNLIKKTSSQIVKIVILGFGGGEHANTTTTSISMWISCFHLSFYLPPKGGGGKSKILQFAICKLKLKYLLWERVQQHHHHPTQCYVPGLFCLCICKKINKWTMKFML